MKSFSELCLILQILFDIQIHFMQAFVYSFAESVAVSSANPYSKFRSVVIPMMVDEPSFP